MGTSTAERDALRPAGRGHMQIGEVAERTALSLRTVRYYDQVGLVTPSARSRGGFRLYTDADVERLELVKRMKPLDLTLGQVRDVLAVLDALDGPAAAPARRQLLSERLATYRELVEQRVESLRAQLAAAEALAGDLRARDGAGARVAGGAAR